MGYLTCYFCPSDISLRSFLLEQEQTRYIVLPNQRIKSQQLNDCDTLPTNTYIHCAIISKDISSIFLEPLKPMSDGFDF